MDAYAGAVGSGVVGVASSGNGALTATSELNVRPFPKILVTFSGTTTLFCVERRVSNDGSIDASTCASGRFTGVESSIEFSAKVPGGAAFRSSPKVTFTDPVGNCIKADLTDSANVPCPGEATNADKFGGSAARIEA